VYKNLDAWGAFSGAHTLEYRRTDGELDAYRASILAAAVSRRLLLPQTHGRLLLAALFMPQGFAERVSLPWRLTRAVAASFFGRETVTRYFMKLDIRDRHMLVDALRFAPGLDK